MLFSDLFHSPTALATLPVAMQFSSIIWGVLSVALIITCLVLILVILLQDPKSAGLTSAFGRGQSGAFGVLEQDCLLYTSPSPRDKRQSRMPSSA